MMALLQLCSEYELNDQIRVYNKLELGIQEFDLFRVCSSPKCDTSCYPPCVHATTNDVT
jgi:hypothetical protein